MTDAFGASNLQAKILVADDEPANVRLLMGMLERAGYTDVVSTESSSEVEGLFERWQPELVLLDLHMPEPDGFEVMARLRLLTPAGSFLPILVLSGDPTDSAKQRALAGGAKDFLPKPFQYTEMLLRIGNLLETKSLYVEVQRQMSEVQAQLDQAVRIEDERLRRHAEIADRLKSVIDEDGLNLVFQPIVDLVDGAIVGAEALSRFVGPPHQTPDVWFAEAAEVGLGGRLQMHAIELAVAQFDELPAGTFLSVNASPPVIRSAEFAYLLDRIPVERVVVELTEDDLVADYGVIDSALRSARRRGLRLAVDDAGSGFASLSHILRLSPDIIKLDRFLIAAVDRCPARRSLVTALAFFAEETGASVIAEGIETPEELLALRELGVELGQGYLLGRGAPLPLAVELSPASFCSSFGRAIMSSAPARHDLLA
jgi:EAL domain-containing protein (putative c-di-GMP-specific phosphodiesterase class I)/AmiR/NasT family two-component response regulator